MKRAIVASSLILVTSCIFDGEFAEDVHIRDAAARCGLSGFDIVREEGVDYLEVVMSAENQRKISCMTEYLDEIPVTLSARAPEGSAGPAGTERK